MARYVDTEYGRVWIVTGEVIDCEQTIHHHTVERTETIGYARRTSTSTSSTKTQEITLRDQDGGEHSGSLPEKLIIGLRRGATATLAWFIPKGKDEGMYLASANHQTGEIRRVGLHNMDKSVGCMIFIAGILLLAVGGLGVIVLAGLGWFFYKAKVKTDVVMAVADLELGKELSAHT